MALRPKFNKSDIASCLLCYEQAEYVYSIDLRNVLLSVVLFLNLIALISVVMFAPSIFYIPAALVITGIVSFIVKGLMHVELRCKKCKNSLLI